jgi:hypothetical protein
MPPNWNGPHGAADSPHKRPFPPERRKSWLRSIWMEIAAKRSVKSRGNFNLRCRRQPPHQAAPTVLNVIGHQVNSFGVRTAAVAAKC